MSSKFSVNIFNAIESCVNLKPGVTRESVIADIDSQLATIREVIEDNNGILSQLTGELKDQAKAQIVENGETIDEFAQEVEIGRMMDEGCPNTGDE